METKDLLSMFIIVFIVAIMLQVWVIVLIYQNKDKIDADPFVYGANKFNLDNVNCFVKDGISLYFNKTESKFIINENAKKFEPIKISLEG